MGGLAALVGVVAVLVMHANGHSEAVDVAVELAAGWSFVGAGIVAWARRPANPIGRLLVAVGFAWFVNQLAAVPTAWMATVCQALSSAYLALLAHLLLAFPTGRLTSRAARVITAGAYLDAVGLQVVWLLVAPPCEECASNLLLVAPNLSLAREIEDVQIVAAVVLTVALMAVLLQRWHIASVAARRMLTPIVIASSVAAVMLVVMLVNDRFVLGLDRAVSRLYMVTLACVPLAFLAGLLRTRLAHAGVAELMVRLGEGVAPGALRDALARGLGDPLLQLAYWIPEHSGYVDLDGHAVTVPTGGAQATTVIECDGRRIGALIHDPALNEHPELVAAVRAAAALALENERLQAELRARLSELDRSRARLVEAADAERRRIERNLHDAVQQRLMSASLALSLAGSKLPTNPAAASALVDEAQSALAIGLQELRQISQGIHPAMLTQRGLKAALTELTWTAPLAVSLSADLDGRLPEQVEATAYYVVAEALANVSKHAQATQAWVAARQAGDRLVIEVRDDGAGGADSSKGTGLSGLADRAAAAGGKLEIHSPIGAGTRIRAELPCG
jgi:signal transduction histidine kinase